MSNEERATIGTVSNKGKAPLTRLQRIITGESSKAVKLKNKTKPARKAKTQQNCRSCMSGKLALMFQMPMEVFCEIAGYLAPLDIIHISRSTERLRDLLMSKTARLIWRTTMRAMEIPKPPGDINEPQLVSLLFETFCQGCGAPRVKKVDYGLRVRLCPGCFSLNVVQGCKAVGNINGISPKDYAVYRLCCFERAAFVTGPLQNGLMTWPDEIYAQQKFFIPDLTDAIRQYKLYDAGSEEQKLFLERRKELAMKFCAHAISIYKWKSVQNRIKANAGLSKIESRKESILKRLKELGYADEDLTNNCSSNSSEWSKIICQPRDLTERTWKSILPRLEGIIATRRSERAAEVFSALRVQRWTEFRSFYATFSAKWKDLEGNTPTMSFEDLQQLPEVKTLVEEGLTKTPLSEAEWTKVESLLFHVVRSHETRMEAVVRDHDKRMKAHCVALIISARESAGLPSVSTESDSDSSNLPYLASSFLVSKESSLFFPTLFYTYDEFLDLHRVAAFRTLIGEKTLTPFVKPCMVNTGCALIRSLGLADTITMAEMEDFGPSFVCKCCNPVHRRKMAWKDLVYHFESDTSKYNAMDGEMANILFVHDHDVDVRTDLAELDLRETLPRNC